MCKNREAFGQEQRIQLWEDTGDARDCQLGGSQAPAAWFFLLDTRPKKGWSISGAKTIFDARLDQGGLRQTRTREQLRLCDSATPKRTPSHSLSLFRFLPHHSSSQGKSHLVNHQELQQHEEQVCRDISHLPWIIVIPSLHRRNNFHGWSCVVRPL